jgi:hypothetical protein
VAPLAGTPMAPLAERGRGKGEGSRDSLQTLPLHDVAHGLGPVEDAGFFGLLDEGISGRERVMGNVECAGPHLRVSSNKLLQKYEHAPSHDVVPSYRHTTFPTQISRKLLGQGRLAQPPAPAGACTDMDS